VILMVGTLALCPPYGLSAVLQRLIIIAVAIAFRRGEVAVLVIIVLYRNVLRLLRFVVGFFRGLALSASSAHVLPFSPAESAFALHADSE
jgi:hypothetical protein